MGDIQVIDTLCGGNKQPVPRISAVPEIAQLYALGLYRAWFRTIYPVGEVISEWDLVGNVSVGTGHSAQDMALRRIKTDFRNYYSKSQKNRALIKSGKAAESLRAGRSVRADGLGIALNPIERSIVTELIEVTTVDEADDTILEDIQPKLAMLRGPIKTLVERELADARVLTSSMLPDKFVANGTPFIVPVPLAVVPIFLDTNAATKPDTKYRWICFGPTYKYRPFPFGGLLGSTPEPESAPARGLIVYSYHESASPVAVPKEVIDRFKDWVRQQQRRYQRLELLPLPEVNRYWKDNNQDLNRMLAYLAVATVAVAGIVLAIYLAPLVIGAAAGLLVELGAVVAIDTLAVQSAALIAAISASVPQALNFARMAVQSIANLDPQMRFAH